MSQERCSCCVATTDARCFEGRDDHLTQVRFSRLKCLLFRGLNNGCWPDKEQGMLPKENMISAGSGGEWEEKVIYGELCITEITQGGLDYCWGH